ncbi:MAG: hypothetical protein JWN76_2459 [Chitinophagaceae bacterium]|nr:hypothetical protein [Chitinophagaceae bacterium]
MKLFEIINSWFDSSEKSELDHFDLDKIRKIIGEIKVEPFLTFMQSQTEEFLRNISISSKESKGQERKFIVINGVSGSGKTNLVYEYLQDFLLATGVIKENKVPINKIACHDINDFGLHGRNIDDVINKKVSDSKDGILIIDEFTVRDKNAPLIADLLKKIYLDKDFLFTAVILMGELKSNSAFLCTYSLENIFPNKFRLNFYTPSFIQIAEVFEAYSQRKGGYILSEKAKAGLIFYFGKIKTIKKIKSDLNRKGTSKFLYRERNFVYTSEMLPIYKDIVAIKTDNNIMIEQLDILNTNSYKKMLNDLQLLEKYIS